MIRDKILKFMGTLATTFPFAILIITLIISLAAFNEAKHLQLKTGQMDLTPKNNPVREKFFDFLQEFEVLDNIYILMSFQDEENAKNCAREIKKKLEKSDIVREVFIHIDIDSIMNRFLYLIEMDKLKEVSKSLNDNKTMLSKLTEKQNLQTLFNIITSPMKIHDGKKPNLEIIERQLGLVNEVLKAMVSYDPDQKEPSKKSISLWRKSFFPEDDTDRIFDKEGYILSKRSKKLLLIVNSARRLAEQEEDIEYFLKVRKVVEETTGNYPGISCGYAGGPAITYDEKQTVESDLLFSTVMSLTGITLLFMFALRTFIHPMLGVTTLLISLLWTFGLTRVAVGHLTLVSSAFTATLIGLGIGFGIHVVSCYEEETAKGASNDEAIINTLLAIGPGLITGAMTSSAAFYTMCLTEFTAFQELGFIAGSGLLISLFNMLLILPAFLTAQSRIRHGKSGTDTSFLLDSLPDAEERPLLSAIGNFTEKNPAIIAFFFILLFCTALPVALLNRFDYNLLNMQASSSPAVLNEQELIKDFNISPEFNAVIVPDEETAALVTKKLQNLDSVALVESISDLIPSDTEAKEKIIKKIAPVINQLQLKRLAQDYPNYDIISRDLSVIKDTIYKLKIYAFMKGKFSLVSLTSELEKSINDWKTSFDSQPYEIGLNRLSLFQKEIFNDLIDDMTKLHKAFNTEPYTLETLPENLKERFTGKTGKYVIYVTPSIDVREELYAKKFIRDTKSVWNNFTGLPVIKDEMIRLIKEGFFEASLYAVIVLCFMAYFDFGNLKKTIIVMFSLVCGTSLTLAGMHILKIKFNPANFVALPIILGIGIDNGVHIMRRFMTGTSLRNVILSTGKSITLNSMTAIIGFGSLAFSSYQGFSTLGMIMVAGVITCYISAVILQPALMYIFIVRHETLKDTVTDTVDDILSFKSE